MDTLANLFSSAETFIALEPEDVAAALMEYAQQRVNPAALETDWPAFHCAALPYAELSSATSPGWPGHLRRAVEHAQEEALLWLQREGLVMNSLSGAQTRPRPLVFTRRGLQMRTRADLASYREASALPVALVHAEIAGRVIPQFLRGDRDSAVSYAFRAVEIAVRSAADFGAEDHGVRMMREAFNQKTGPLTDRSLPVAEQDAESSLFAGALGHGRNPISHRSVDMQPVEAARLILLASHLLSIVEKRKAARLAAGVGGA